VCLAGFIVYANRLQDHAEWLVSHGERTSGTVLADPPSALRCGQVPVPVRFRVAGTGQVHEYFVDGCSGNGLHNGDRVTVHFDPDDPGDFTVNGRASEKPLPTLAAIVGLVVGAFFTGAAAIRAWRLHTERRVLKMHS